MKRIINLCIKINCRVEFIRCRILNIQSDYSNEDIDTIGRCC